MLLLTLLTMMSALFLEALLHLATWTGLLPVIPLVTPWTYTLNTCRYAFDASGSPIFTSGKKSAAERGVPPIPVEYDLHGLRPADASRLGGAGIKIAFFGDSYTEGLQVKDEQTFVRRVEEGLRREGRDIACFNFGVGGTGTYQQWLRYKTLSASARFDTVVVCLLPNNDILNNHVRLGRGIELPGTGYLAAEGDGFVELPPDRSQVRRIGLLRDTIGRFFLLRAGYYGRDLWRQARATLRARGDDWVPGMGGAGTGGNWTTGRGNLLPVYRPDEEGDWPEAWRITEECLRRFDRDVRAQGGKLLVVLVAGVLPVEFKGGPGHGWAEGLDFGHPNRRLTAFCSQAGINCVDSLPHFVERAAAPGAAPLFWKHDSHYTPEGHQALADFLLPILAPPAKPPP